MIQSSFSPSINIVRDWDRDFDYIPTPNAKRVFEQIINSYKSGINSFSIIGSYGTGKSSFLLAFERNLNKRDMYFGEINGQFDNKTEFHFHNLIGEYNSFVETFSKSLNATSDIFSSLDDLYSNIQKDKKILIIVIDEFGKFLEYASKHNPEKELYFVQQLAEFCSKKEIIFISTLHQSFDSYSRTLNKLQRREWEKVKGRIKEIPFNEPVEQLLHLAAERVEEKQLIFKNGHLNEIVECVEKANVFPLHNDRISILAKKLVPLDILSAAVLVKSLQIYGQNERSLFTFLDSHDYLGIYDFDLENNPYYNLSNVYDYLIHNYYSFLSTRYNPNYLQWSGIRRALERIEGDSAFENNITGAQKITKTIGLLNIFSHEAAKINSGFLNEYSKYSHGIDNCEDILSLLEKKKIIRFLNFKDRYILFEGTDLDIEQAIATAHDKIDPKINLIYELQKYFKFPYLSAKAIHYETGTPRFFCFELTETPIHKKPVGEVDGFVNLVFSKSLKSEDIKTHSKSVDEAILFCFYENTLAIEEQVHEIRKVDYIRSMNLNDFVARRELDNLLFNHINELNDLVLNGLYSNQEKVIWICRGEKIEINNKTQFNNFLSRICSEVYSMTPHFKNELANRHKLSASIVTARKKMISALFKDWDKPTLGLPEDKFPPEKTIYYSLLKNTGIHRKVKDSFEVTEPDEPSFTELWKACEIFLDTAKARKMTLSDLIAVLSNRPFKLKQGFIDFWLPIFLFKKKEDFALYEENKYIPFVTPETLELILRKPDKYQVKTFDVSGTKLELFNRYHNLIDAQDKIEFSNTSFVATIRPFLQFYRELPEYSKRTHRLPSSAKRLREVIANATDPEKTFFEDFPKALGYTNIDLDEDESLKEYIYQLQNAFNDLKKCFSDLVDRVESFIFDINNLSGQDFEKKKELLINRYQQIKNQLLLPHQKTFFLRLNSPIEDRTAWLSSLTHALIGKSLEKISDDEEELLYKRFSDIFNELDNLCEFSQIDFDETKEDVLRLEISQPQEAIAKQIVRISKNNTELQQIEERIKALLTGNKTTDISVLVNLLKKQIKNDQS